MKPWGTLSLVVAATVLPAGCGDDQVRSAPCSAAPAGSTVELVYRVQSGDPRATAARLCSRLVAFESARFRVARVGADRIRVVGSDAAETGAAVKAATEGISFQIYDWEPNVLGPRGPATPFAGGTALFNAVELASDSKSASARFYLFGPDKRPLGGPAESKDELLAPYGSGGAPEGSRVVGIPAGLAVVEDQRIPGEPPRLHRYFVIEGDAELSRADVENPRAGAEGVTGAPVVSFDFTPSGRRAFKALTERVASRAAAAGGASEASFQHFAIVVDDRIVSLPAVDAATNPDGIHAPGAQIAGLGSLEDARRVARRLAADPLDAKLELISVR